jgi:cold shock protein
MWSELMIKGTVKWFSGQKGYGFIAPEDGSEDAFVHISALQNAGLAGLDEGQKVEFDLTPGRNGKLAADNIRIIE